MHSWLLQSKDFEYGIKGRVDIMIMSKPELCSLDLSLLRYTNQAGPQWVHHLFSFSESQIIHQHHGPCRPEQNTLLTNHAMPDAYYGKHIHLTLGDEV